jgi:histone acetyltransferase
MSSFSTRSVHKSPERNIMERLLADLQGHAVAWAFLQPVNADEVTDYYDVIKEPMGEPSSLTKAPGLLNTRVFF